MNAQEFKKHLSLFKKLIEKTENVRLLELFISVLESNYRLSMNSNTLLDFKRKFGGTYFEELSLKKDIKDGDFIRIFNIKHFDLHFEILCIGDYSKIIDYKIGKNKYENLNIKNFNEGQPDNIIFADFVNGQLCENHTLFDPHYYNSFKYIRSEIEGIWYDSDFRVILKLDPDGQYKIMDKDAIIDNGKIFGRYNEGRWFLNKNNLYLNDDTIDNLSGLACDVYEATKLRNDVLRLTDFDSTEVRVYIKMDEKILPNLHQTNEFEGFSFD